MTVSAAEFFQMLKMEFRLDSMAHPRLLFLKRKTGRPGRPTTTRSNCALADDKGRKGIGGKKKKKIQNLPAW